MTESTTLGTFYDGWQTYQQHIVSAIADLTPDQLELRAAPHMRSVYAIVSHIIGARARWFNNLMGEGGDAVAALQTWDRPNTPQHTPAELVAALETTWQAMHAALTRWTPDDMAHTFTGLWGENPYRLARQWVVWHVLEHDLSHGGELFLTLGIHNLPTPDL